LTKCHSSKVPDVNIAALKAGMEVVVGGIERGAVVSCHDVSDGGIAVALAEMCIGGDTGAEVDLSNIGKLRADARLFSESNSRWVVELRKGKEKLMPKDRRARMVRLGTVGGDSLRVSSGKLLVDTDTDRLAKSFNETLWRLL
jgi:phosphoribosylformylglycinamidine synthase